MSRSSRSNQTIPRSPRRGRATPPAPNRAQVKAMEARSVVAPTEPHRREQLATDVPSLVEQSSATNAAEASTTATGVLPERRRVRSALRVTPLPRNVEFAYIRSDMRRLSAIAAGLLVLMLLLLIVLGR